MKIRIFRLISCAGNQIKNLAIQWNSWPENVHFDSLLLCGFAFMFYQALICSFSALFFQLFSLFEFIFSFSIWLHLFYRYYPFEYTFLIQNSFTTENYHELSRKPCNIHLDSSIFLKILFRERVSPQKTQTAQFPLESEHCSFFFECTLELN